MITRAKALTNGVVPMGAVAVNDKVHNVLMDAAPEAGIELFHGYTYSGCPVACRRDRDARHLRAGTARRARRQDVAEVPRGALFARSEEHTSEPQSLLRISYAITCW